MKHSRGVVLHFRFFKIEIFGLVVGNANLHPLPVGLLRCSLVGGPAKLNIWLRCQWLIAQMLELGKVHH